MKTITVKASDIRNAIARAQTVSDDWQAQHIEILRQPRIYKRWQELNSDRNLTLAYHSGQKPTGDREANLARCEAKTWAEYAGYTLDFGGYRWNAVTDEWYGHSPACCWDGVRRETKSYFIECLRLAYYCSERNLEPAAISLGTLMQAGIRYVNDL